MLAVTSLQAGSSHWLELTNIPIDSLYGFATVDADGQATTTGGLGGDTVIVTSGDQLNQIMLDRKDAHFEDNHPPLNLLISGTIHYTAEEMLRVKETYDLSILGMGDSAVIEGFGLNVYKSHNIIIQNIEFRDCPDDAVNIDQTLTHHIWVDHCTFSDSPAVDPSGNDHDGLVDVKHGAAYVTISWNHFYNHTKTCLLGHSDSNGAEDIGRLKVTYHHNWFDNTHSRHPRVRFGQAHVLNNYYDGSDGTMLYGVASTMDADVVVEANYFQSVLEPTHVGYADSGPGDLVEFDNIFLSSGTVETGGESFDPSTYYSYPADAAGDLPDLVTAFAGAGILGNLDPTALDEQGRTLVPERFELGQNYPNPFNGWTVIPFDLRTSARVSLQIFTVQGEAVATVQNNWLSAGSYRLRWNGSTSDGTSLPTGLYVARLTVGLQSNSVKMLLLK